jgi:hypothetical protein
MNGRQQLINDAAVAEDAHSVLKNRCVVNMFLLHIHILISLHSGIQGRMVSYCHLSLLLVLVKKSGGSAQRHAHKAAHMNGRQQLINDAAVAEDAHSVL